MATDEQRPLHQPRVMDGRSEQNVAPKRKSLDMPSLDPEADRMTLSAKKAKYDEKVCDKLESSIVTKGTFSMER